ncbi:hypothetical protein CPC08DRAFT_687668 [Agrocybe pediades]|nr:hypothetical protein CPC08DRAFT_687668 [Agrocybe pediades]
MARLHQAYVIARQGENYHFVAALHCACCYGCEPLRAAAQFLSLVQQPRHAWIMQEELFYSGTSPVVNYNNFEIPYPFIHFLLSSAWSVNLQDANDILVETCHIGRALPVDEGIGHGGNDGMTVLDISDPFSPSYYFFFVPTMVPLSAETYVRAYSEEWLEAGKLEQVEKRVQAAIRSLDRYPIISLNTLHATWPDVYRVTGVSNWLSDRDVDLLVVPTLVDLIFRRAVERAISKKTIDKLGAFFNINEKVSVMKDILRAQNPFKNGASFVLLQKLLEAESPSKHIDMSLFCLSKHQIKRLFNGQHWMNAIEDINISGTPHFNISHLKELLVHRHLPSLRRVNLWNTGVANHELKQLLDTHPCLFYRIEGLIHPVFFTYSSGLSPAMSFIVRNPYTINEYGDGALVTSLPYFLPSQLVQGFLDILGPILNTRQQGKMDAFERWKLEENSLWIGTFASEVRPEGTRWSERTIPYIPSFAKEQFHPRQWFFVLDLKKNCYAFGRFIPGIGESLYAELSTLKATWTGDKYTPHTEVMKVINKTRGKHRRRLLELFDVHLFFRALEEEGRPPPDRQALNELLVVFTKLSSLPARPSYGEKGPALKLMSQKELEEAVCHILWPTPRPWPY